MWIPLYIVASILKIALSDSVNYHIGEIGTTKHHETFNHQTSITGPLYHGTSTILQIEIPKETKPLKGQLTVYPEEYSKNVYDKDSNSPYKDHKPGNNHREKLASSLDEHSLNNHDNPTYYNRQLSPSDDEYYHMSNYGRHIRESIFDSIEQPSSSGEDDYSSEYPDHEEPHHHVLPPHSHFHEQPSPPHPRGRPFHSRHRRPHHSRGLPPPHHRGPHPPPHHRGPHPPPHHRGPHPPPHHRGPPPPPHHRGPRPPPHHRGPPHPPHHRGPPPPPDDIGPPAFPGHRGPPSYPDHKGPQQLPPPRFSDNARDDKPVPSNNNQPPRKNEPGKEMTPHSSNHNKPSKTMESAPNNTDSYSTTTEEEFVLDIRFGNEEIDNEQKV